MEVQQSKQKQIVTKIKVTNKIITSLLSGQAANVIAMTDFL